MSLGNFACLRIGGSWFRGFMDWGFWHSGIGLQALGDLICQLPSVIVERLRV